jgi:hypothetical protein
MYRCGKNILLNISYDIDPEGIAKPSPYKVSVLAGNILPSLNIISTSARRILFGTTINLFE